MSSLILKREVGDSYRKPLWRSIIFNPSPIKTKIYIAGAFTGKYPHETPVPYVLVYDQKKEKWEIPGYLQRGRHGTSLAKIGNNIYIAAGSGNRGGGPELGSIEVTDLETR